MSRNNSGPGFRRRPRIADHMTEEMVACVEQSTAAERAGDAAAALEWHQAVPMFRRSRHRAMLDQLSRLGDDLPPWVCVRWLVYQAIRCEDPGSETGELHRAAMRYVTEAVHGDLLADCYEEGGDPVQVGARVIGESWMFHQVFVHESGGLVSYLREFMTSGRLAEHADLALAWAESPLTGCRVGESLPGGRLQVDDLVSDSPLEVLDLGARSSAGPGGWVLGRLVPSGVDDLPMFDVPPLAVSERIAREVAGMKGEGAWGPLSEALAEGRFVPHRLLREDYELVTDVQELDLLRFGTPARDLERVMRQLRDGRDEVGRAAYRILQRAVDGTVDEADAAWVAAAAVNAHANADARNRLLRAGQCDAWSRWAALVPEPGRGVLSQFAEATRAVA